MGNFSSSYIFGNENNEDLRYDGPLDLDQIVVLHIHSRTSELSVKKQNARVHIEGID